MPRGNKLSESACLSGRQGFTEMAPWRWKRLFMTKMVSYSESCIIRLLFTYVNPDQS